MWIVTSNSVTGLPDEDINQIKAVIDKLASEGTTSPDYIIDPTPLPGGLNERQRQFTTLAAAEEYATVINNLPSDLINVIDIYQAV